MRTTIELDDDTAAAVQQLRAQEHRGLSDAVNELIRRGIMQRPHEVPFVPRTAALGLKIDVSNVAEALDHLEGSESR
jgi:hypothetical protein